MSRCDSAGSQNDATSGLRYLRSQKMRKDGVNNAYNRAFLLTFYFIVTVCRTVPAN